MSYLTNNSSARDLDAKTLGNVIRRLREIRDITQEDAALAGNLCQSYLSHVENGNNSISVHKLFSLTRGLHFSEVEFATIYAEEYKRLQGDPVTCQEINP